MFSWFCKCFLLITWGLWFFFIHSLNGGTVHIFTAASAWFSISFRKSTYWTLIVTLFTKQMTLSTSLMSSSHLPEGYYYPVSTGKHRQTGTRGDEMICPLLQDWEMSELGSGSKTHAPKFRYVRRHRQKASLRAWQVENCEGWALFQEK